MGIGKNTFFIVLLLLVGCGVRKASLDYLETSNEAPLKNFWAAKRTRGIAAVPVTTADYQSATASKSLDTREVVVMNGGAQWTVGITVSAAGDVFSVQRMGGADTTEIYKYLGTLSESTLSALNSLVGQLAVSAYSERRLIRFDCNGQIQSMSEFGVHYIVAFNNVTNLQALEYAKVDMRKEQGLCEATVVDRAETYTLVRWTNYLMSLAKFDGDVPASTGQVNQCLAVKWDSIACKQLVGVISDQLKTLLQAIMQTDRTGGQVIQRLSNYVPYLSSSAIQDYFFKGVNDHIKSVCARGTNSSYQLRVNLGPYLYWEPTGSSYRNLSAVRDNVTKCIANREAQERAGG